MDGKPPALVPPPTVAPPRVSRLRRLQVRVSASERVAAAGDAKEEKPAAGAGEAEVGSVGLDRMVLNFMEESAAVAERPPCGRCNCFNGSNYDESDDEKDFFLPSGLASAPPPGGGGFPSGSDGILSPAITHSPPASSHRNSNFLPASDPIGELSMTDTAISHMAVVGGTTKSCACARRGRTRGVGDCRHRGYIQDRRRGNCVVLLHLDSPIPGPLRSMSMTCSTEGSPEQRKSGEAGIYLVKRDGRQEALHFAKIMSRLKKLSYGLSQEHGDPVLIRMSALA
ncbi:hypothetical protein ACQ4PT_015962 [Festuca glaucescens]